MRIELGHGTGTFQRKMIAIRGLLYGDFAVGRGIDICRCTGITV